MAALLNVQIPLYLGELIDAMTEIIKEHSQVLNHELLSLILMIFQLGAASLAPITPVVMKLVASYTAQVFIHSFIFIHICNAWNYFLYVLKISPPLQ